MSSHEQMVRRWTLGDLGVAAEPLLGHESSVRTLAAGDAHCLVSGDADGDICIWTLAAPL